MGFFFFKFLNAEENISYLKNILPRHQAILIQQFYASVTLHPFQKVCVEWGVGLESLVMIDQTHLQGTDLRGQCTQFKCDLENITLLLYNADLHSFCQGNCMLPL